MGGREKQVHVALSRMAMFQDYEYLFEGSEFDRRMLQSAGLDELLPLLKSRGKSRLVQVILPGSLALDGAHPFFPIDETRRIDLYPNLVRTLLTEFAWQLYNPSSPRRSLDLCLMFREAIPAAFIETVETIDPVGAT